MPDWLIEQMQEGWRDMDVTVSLSGDSGQGRVSQVTVKFQDGNNDFTDMRRGKLGPVRFQRVASYGVGFVVSGSRRG